MRPYVTAGVLSIGLLVGCASLQINTDYAQEVDFSKYKTFAYKDTDKNLSDTNELAHRRIVDAIRREMLGKGMQETGASPDVYVTYHGEDKEQIALDTNYYGYRYGPGWRWGRIGVGSSRTTVRTYTQGTLIVDIWDARENQLVWRGVATDTISDNPEKNITKLNKALTKMFDRFPPGGSS